MKNITIKDVAREAGVSTTLVSRVLNAGRDAEGNLVCAVNASTAKRIQDTIRRLGYRPNKAAVSLRKSLKKRIGVILPDLAHPYFASIAKHFEALARKDGYTVLFGSSDDSPATISDLAETFIQDNADAIIIIPGVNCGEAVAAIAREGVPVLLAVRDIEGLEGVGRVLTDNRAATELMLGHLLSQGYGRIAMLSSTLRLSNIVERERLYEEFMQERGLQPRIFHQDNSDRETSTLYIIREAVRQGYDALYCPGASQPVLCAGICKKEGIRIPQDIALSGYDGMELYSVITPSITQISFPAERVAEEAFRSLKGMDTVFVAPVLLPAASAAARQMPRDGTPLRGYPSHCASLAGPSRSRATGGYALPEHLPCSSPVPPGSSHPALPDADRASLSPSDRASIASRLEALAAELRLGLS